MGTMTMRYYRWEKAGFKNSLKKGERLDTNKKITGSFYTDKISNNIISIIKYV